MKEMSLNLTTMLVLLVFIFTVFVDMDSPTSKKEFVIDKARSEGFVAFIVTFMPLLSGHLGGVAVPVQEIGEF